MDERGGISNWIYVNSFVSAAQQLAGAPPTAIQLILCIQNEHEHNNDAYSQIKINLRTVELIYCVYVAVRLCTDL